MKKYVSIIFILLITQLSFAQDNGITYQAVIYQPAGELSLEQNNLSSPMANSVICMQFRIVDLTGNIEYEEVINTKTDAFGMVNLIIGTNKQSDGYVDGFDSVLWDNFDKYLRVGLDLEGACSQFEEISYQRFNYVPLAYNAKSAESVTGIVPISNGGTGGTTLAEAKTNLEMNNVENTSDADKPISTASQRVLDLKEDRSNKSFDVMADATSDVKYPSVKAVKTYIDENVSPGGGALTAEITRATAAESANATAIAAEETRAMAAELTLTTNLATEITDRTDADLVKADIDSPTFIGMPLAPTATTGTNTTQIATTQFVTSLSDNYLPLIGGSLTGALLGTAATFSSSLEVPSLSLRSGTTDWRFALDGSDLVLHQGGCCNRLTIDTNGNFGIGANYTPSYQLDVEGNGRFTSALIADSFKKEGGTSSQFLKADGSVDDTEYALLDSPTFTGIPLAPTATTGTSTTQIASTAFVTNAVNVATTGNFVDLTSSQTIMGKKTFFRNMKIYSTSWANSATMNIGFPPSGENLSGISIGIDALRVHQYGVREIGIGNEALYKDLRGTDLSLIHI